ncbi:UNVERIFIED_CONTAM: DNA-directed RNA polymerase II subunit rpb1 [Siphonaria sp. JEL0065]|nr:DNA-directed RNA polymerase II subunit rpb1 [Siphonaria sp. JEL0065]
MALDEFETRRAEQEFYNLTPHDTRVLITNGQVLSGYLSKKTAGTSSGGIVHIIFNDYGHIAARDFIDNASKLITVRMQSNGFSVGIGDAWVLPSTQDTVDSQIERQLEKAHSVVPEYQTAHSAGKTTVQMSSIDNNVRQMVEAGSKGSILNICQISACVGQQIVEGKRIPFGFKYRTLPHFVKFDDSPMARGFVRNSFVRGVTPSEFFFHAMGGCEGLIDTAVKTAATGYIQWRLVKALEDITVQTDGTVRNSWNDIIQFQYGEDGMDGTVIEYQTFPTLMLSDQDFYDRCYCFDAEWSVLVEDREFLRRVLRLPEDRWTLPLNVQRYITRAKVSQQQEMISKDYPAPLSPTPAGVVLQPQYVFERVQKLRNLLRPVFQFKNNTSQPNSCLLGILLSSYLYVKQVIYVHKLKKYQFEWILGQMNPSTGTALYVPGSLWVVAAQSIGEPATQMTLNTFHLSGTGNKAVTSGIPRP